VSGGCATKLHYGIDPGLELAAVQVGVKGNPDVVGADLASKVEELVRSEAGMAKGS
jgi:hypothetical protein